MISNEFGSQIDQCGTGLAHHLAEHFSGRCRDDGVIPYFVTTTYNERKDNPLTSTRANKLFKFAHNRLLRYLARSNNIGRSWFREIEPEVHAFLDVPGSKPKHYKSASLPRHESTFHHHCIFLCNERYAPLMDALCEKRCADDFAEKIRAHCQLRTINVQRMLPSPADMEKVTSYCTHYASRFFGKDEWDIMYQVYPKSGFEFKNGH